MFFISIFRYINHIKKNNMSNNETLSELQAKLNFWQTRIISAQDKDVLDFYNSMEKETRDKIEDIQKASLANQTKLF